MKTCIKNLFLLPALIVGLDLIQTDPTTAQIFTNQHSFTAFDGAYPEAGLILSGTTLYSTTYSGGGSSGDGTVFKINANGTGFRNLHSFTANSDGANSQAGLILSGTTLYGTARNGGSSGNGTVFAVNTDGTGFTNLHNFTALFNSTNSEGVHPYAGLVLSGNTLYGTCYQGGNSHRGTVFAVNTDGTGFTNLHSLISGEGEDPAAGLILAGNTLYGTAVGFGTLGLGTVFALNTNGSSFTNLHVFTNTSGPLSTNTDGATPFAGLILSGNTLYGTTSEGGGSGYGTVFAVNTDGTGFTNLHWFTNGSDGANPNAGLTLSGNTLYGTAYAGGSLGNGTVFAVNTDGTGFTTLHSFDFSSEGGYPLAGLILSGNTLYGTAQGGTSGVGMVFSLSLLPPLLTIIPYGVHVIVSWPTNTPTPPAGFTLKSTTNLVSPSVWSIVSPGPVIVNGQNAVTNLISGAQQFYRLSQ
jgi:uncharacterized repeat protein (TIGR03803 family)